MNHNHIEDTHALLNSTEASHAPMRRLALQTALGIGYAAAAMPLMAQTAVQTSAEGLTTGRVEIDVNGFKCQRTARPLQAKPICLWCW